MICESEKIELGTLGVSAKMINVSNTNSCFSNFSMKRIILYLGIMTICIRM